MSDNIQRNPDELWTRYLVRRLNSEVCGDVPLFENANLVSANKYEIILKIELETGDGKIEIVRGHVSPYEAASQSKSYKELEERLKENFFEAVYIDKKPYDENGLNLEFLRDGNVEVLENNAWLEGILSKYRVNETYKAEDVVEDVIKYAKESGIIKTLSSEENKLETPFGSQILIGTEQQRTEIKDNSRKLDEILRSLRKLEYIVAEHPLVMKSEDMYLKELYVKVINDDICNLRFFEYEGKIIPYVLVNSSDIRGVGKAFKNLCFVSSDKACEDWQQKIVAYHEFLESRIGHDEAKRRELPLARFLGKEKQYFTWREQIDNGSL